MFVVLDRILRKSQWIVGNFCIGMCTDRPEIIDLPGTFGMLFLTYYAFGHTYCNITYFLGWIVWTLVRRGRLTAALKMKWKMKWNTSQSRTFTLTVWWTRCCGFFREHGGGCVRYSGARRSKGKTFYHLLSRLQIQNDKDVVLMYVVKWLISVLIVFFLNGLISTVTLLNQNNDIDYDVSL